MSQTCRCGTTTQEGSCLCRDCVRTLDHALMSVALHYADLDTLRTKRTRYGTLGAGKGSTGKTMPLGVDLRFVNPSDVDGQREGQAAKLVTDVQHKVAAWTSRAITTWPELLPRLLERTAAASAATHTSICCVFLDSYLTAIAGQPWAPELYGDITRLEAALVKVVDRPADRWYAGKCSVPDEHDVTCEQELYAEAGAATIRCPRCHITHDVAERRDYLLAQAKDVLVTATEAAGALLAWTDYDGSEAKLVDQIYRWRERGRLESRGAVEIGGKQRPLYRLGDIQDQLVAHAQREQARRIKSTA